MFMGPFEATMAWNERTLNGVKRFLDKFYKFISEHIDNKSASGVSTKSDSSREVRVLINKLIDGMTKDMEGFGYNTAIAKMMETLNKFSNSNFQFSNEDIKTLIKLIAPLAPYTAEELWAKVGNADLRSVHIAGWPKAEEKYLVDEEVTIMVAVNGKVRDQIRVESYKVIKSESEIIEMAKKTEKIQKWIEGKKITKEIYIPGKMVNLVIG